MAHTWMGWDEALKVWNTVLDELMWCATGFSSYAVLDEEDCQAVCTVLAEISREWDRINGKQ